ncbi:endoribonuclease ysh1 [Elasticomyces elasticus]|nr:endoribonuclease ysh1 [Elasticomyces elasticus]
MATKRPHAATIPPSTLDDDPIDPSDELTFIALGGGNEVGRSCHILQYKGKTVMLDAGIHPAYDGLAALPFYDEFDLGSVDVLLVTHFHMDHAASLPYVLAKTPFAGKTYMTHPTKAIYKHLMQDSVRVQNTHTSTSASSGGTDGYIHQLFSEQDILSTLPQIQTISFNTTHTHNGIRFTPLPAGHVLGACMYLIEIAGLNILFTGDYSRETDRHLIPASVPQGVKIDLLITESTFGISTHVPRMERETELLLIFEDYWARHEEYRRYPIYYASSLARKCMVVYQTYIEAMNANIRDKFQAASAITNSTSSTTSPEDPDTPTGPWDFRFIRSLKSLDRFDDVGGCVMLASPGMLQNGVSRALLERWCPDPKNGVVITGYSVEGTMAKQIMLEPDSIPAVMTNRAQGGGVMGGGKREGMNERVMVPRRCTVQEYSFAAHVDGSENREFIEQVGAEVVVLVHGEKHNMMRLKSRLLGLGGGMKVFSPANCEVLKVPFRREKVVRVVGRLANEVQVPGGEKEGGEGGEAKRRKEGQVVSGVLVQNDFKLSLMAPEDLKEYAGLTTTTILCRQRVTLGAAGVELVRWALEGTFGGVTIMPSSRDAEEKVGNGGEVAMKNGSQEETIMEVMGGAVRVIHRSPSGEVEMEWEGNVANDGIADAVMAVLLSVESSPAAVRQSAQSHSHNHQQQEREKSWDAFGDSPVEDEKMDGKMDGVLEEKTARKRNPLADVTAEERLSRLFMFLEAQFGEDAISPVATPRFVASNGHSGGEDGEDEGKVAALELARLHDLGIPVPGLEIKVDKHVAKVWLEGLEVECGNKTLGDRVRAVVERACGTLAPLWG